MRRKKLADRWYNFKKHSFKLAAVALFIMILAAVTDLLYHGSGMGIFSLLIYLAAIIVYTVNIMAYDEKRYSLYDEYIIKNSFRGVDAASRKFRKAMELMRAGEYLTLSLEIFQEVAEYQLEEREKAVLYYYIGAVYREMGYPTNAALYFEKSADIEILHPAVLLNAERSYSAAGNAEKAEELIEKMYSLEYDKKYYDFLETDRGRIYLSEDMADKAFEIYSAAYENGLDKTGAICGLAVSCLLLGDVEKSRSYYRSASLKADYFSSQRGFDDYYEHIARSCGLYEEIKDILPSRENLPNSENTDADEEKVSDRE